MIDKKKLMAVLLCAFVFMTMIPMVASADDEDTITATVTIQHLSIELFEDDTSTPYTTWAMGTVSAGYDNMASTDGVYMKNTGNVTENYKIKTSNTANWTAGSSAGENVFVLRAEIQATAEAPTLDGSETALTTSYQTCNGTLFAGSGDGFEISAGSGDYLYLRFESPTSTTYYTEQTITITVGCVASS